jgi:hypothetical protein
VEGEQDARQAVGPVGVEHTGAAEGDDRVERRGHQARRTIEARRRPLRAASDSLHKLMTHNPMVRSVA